VIATPVNGDVERLIPRLEEFGSTGTAKAVATQIAGQCVGLVSHRPDRLSSEALVAIGDWVEIAELPSSMATARAVWLVADDDRPGVHDVSTETWRLAVASSPAISSHLWDTYVAPLEPHTEAGEQLLQTLAMFLRRGRSVRETAEALFVHQNTVRYRVTHYEGLVGRSLAETATLVELAWALEADRQRRQAIRRPVDPD
jgi:sugar diacid utilization regulator